MAQVWAWYKVAESRWQLLFSKTRRRYREFIALQNALEANPAYASSCKGKFLTGHGDGDDRDPADSTGIPRGGLETNDAGLLWRWKDMS